MNKKPKWINTFVRGPKPGADQLGVEDRRLAEDTDQPPVLETDQHLATPPNAPDHGKQTRSNRS